MSNLSDGQDAVAGRDSSLFELVAGMLEHRWLMLGIPGAAVVLGVSLYLFGPRTYSAQSKFLPQSTQGATSRLAGLAAQFGFTAAGGAGGEPGQYYADLVRSRELLREAARSSYRVPTSEAGDSVAQSYTDWREVEGETELKRELSAADLLAEQIAVDVDMRSGIVTLRTTERSRAVVEQINRRLLTLINEFNLRRRQSQAGAERAFVEQRLEAALADLRSAEQEAESFLQRNRTYQGSPSLVFAYSRIERKVDLRQQVYVTLAQALEQARIDEVRNTPVITIISGPEFTASRNSSLPFTVLTALLLGGLLGGTAALVIEYVRYLRRAEPVAFTRLTSSWPVLNRLI